VNEGEVNDEGVLLYLSSASGCASFVNLSGFTLIRFLLLCMPLPFCVYILFSKKDFLLYIGFSGNLEAGIKKHNAGGAKSTSYRRPLVLIFCEFYLYEEDARKREMYFKTNMGKKALKLMLRTTLEKMDYKNVFKNTASYL
jgi:putative endonuclease